MPNKKPEINKLRNDTKIEVKMTKIMDYGLYLKMFQQAKNKGWEVQAFQIGFNK